MEGEGRDGRGEGGREGEGKEGEGWGGMRGEGKEREGWEEEGKGGARRGEREGRRIS